jgi:hypothetical protein
MPTECEECGAEPNDPENLQWYSGLPSLDGTGFHGKTLCHSCLAEKPLLFSVAYSTNGPMKLVSNEHIFTNQEKATASAKALASLNKGRQFMVWASKGNFGMARFMEDVALTIPPAGAMERVDAMREEMNKAIEAELVKGCQEVVAKEMEVAAKKDEKGGAFTQLAMFAGGLLGAGIANAAKGGAPGVRVADVVSDDVSEVVEAVAKEAVG